METDPGGHVQHGNRHPEVEIIDSIFEAAVHRKGLGLRNGPEITADRPFIWTLS
jgi:hypothetical protein